MDNQQLLQAMQAMIEPIKKDLSEIKERTSRIEERTTKTEILLENNIEKRLNLLGEGQQMVIEKFHHLDALTEKVEDIQTTVEVLRAITVKK